MNKVQILVDRQENWDGGSSILFRIIYYLDNENSKKKTIIFYNLMHNLTIYKKCVVQVFKISSDGLFKRRYSF